MQNLNMFLDELQIYAKDNNIPIISKNTQKFLKKLLEKKKPNVCLEVWTAIWFSTIFQASIIQKRWWFLCWFEISSDAYQKATNNIIKSRLNNLIIYNTDFLRFSLKKIHKKIDFVFIDAMKMDYVRYLQKILQFQNSNISILLDNVYKYDYKMYSLYEFVKKNQLNYKLFKLSEHDWVMLITIK